MARQLRILQSLRAIERQRADTAEWPRQTNSRIPFIDSSFATEVTSLLRTRIGQTTTKCAFVRLKCAVRVANWTAAAPLPSAS